jgi:hypothetical protein
MRIALFKWQCKPNSFEKYTAGLQIFRGLFFVVLSEGMFEL